MRNADPFLSSKVYASIGPLEEIGIDGNYKPSPEQTREIIATLKEELAKLPE